MNSDWSDFEVREVVKDYFDMLTKEIRQVAYKKSAHRKKLRSKLPRRSEGSIEFKHQNISAVLVSFGRPYIIGYKPRSNYQKKLEFSVLDFLEEHQYVDQDFEQFAEAVPAGFEGVDFNKWIQPIPELLTLEETPVSYDRKIAKINFLEKEQQNRKLGEEGEHLVIQYEKWRLIRNNNESLADKVEWISRDYGDGAGFDILSRNLDGTDRYVEVKTTKSGKYTPVYLTRNELSFSIEKASNYYLYRLYEFGRSPKMFSANGSIDKVCKIEPLSYIGRFK